MKRKIALIVLGLSLFGSGIALGSSQWGTFQGKQIVHITNSGKDLTAADVPAYIDEGRTMVPLYLLRQAGMQVTWNGSEYVVDISKPEPLTETQKADIAKNIGMVYVHNKSGTWSQGTGFMTESGAFLTAFHVLDDNGTIGDIRVDLNGKSYNVTDVAFSDKGMDVAELKFTADVPGLKVQKTPWLDGQMVSAVGYEHGKYKWIDGVSEASEYGIHHSAFIDSGGSGSPLLNVNGEVIAVNVSGTDILKTGNSTAILEFINKLR